MCAPSWNVGRRTVLYVTAGRVAREGEMLWAWWLVCLQTCKDSTCRCAWALRAPRGGESSGGSGAAAAAAARRRLLRLCSASMLPPDLPSSHMADE